MKYDLTNRTVAITGAAGGLGQDLAKALRARGASVALLDLDADAVGDLAERLSPGVTTFVLVRHRYIDDRLAHALAGHKFLPAGRILAGAGTGRSVVIRTGRPP